MLVTEGIHRFSGSLGARMWGANVYLLVGETLALVDTGFRGRANGIVREMARLGYSPFGISNHLLRAWAPNEEDCPRGYCQPGEKGGKAVPAGGRRSEGVGVK